MNTSGAHREDHRSACVGTGEAGAGRLCSELSTGYRAKRRAGLDKRIRREFVCVRGYYGCSARSHSPGNGVVRHRATHAGGAEQAPPAAHFLSYAANRSDNLPLPCGPLSGRVLRGRLTRCLRILGLQFAHQGQEDLLLRDSLASVEFLFIGQRAKVLAPRCGPA